MNKQFSCVLRNTIKTNFDKHNNFNLRISVNKALNT